MTRIERLRREALESCRFRGHDMEQFRTFYRSLTCTVRDSLCKVCDKQVVICTSPHPNEIGIGGEAVALNCKD